MVLLDWPPPHYRVGNLGILWEAAEPGEPLPWGSSFHPAQFGAHTSWPPGGGMDTPVVVILVGVAPGAPCNPGD